MYKKSIFLISLVLLAVLAGSASGQTIYNINISLVDSNIMLGTAATHTQMVNKVISNDHGIFASYTTMTELPQEWRLAQSTDGGQTFNVVYSEFIYTNPPPLCTDVNNTIYASASMAGVTTLKFYKFYENDYSNPVTSIIPEGSGSKKDMCFDAARNCCYVVNMWGQFVIIDVETGSMVDCSTIYATNPVTSIGPHYPHVRMDGYDNIHYVMRADDSSIGTTISTLHLMSRDGGLSWERFDGTAVSVPTYCDADSEADILTYGQGSQTNNMLYKNGKMHFFNMLYLQEAIYLRYDLATGYKDRDSSLQNNGKIRGETIVFQDGGAGFFATDESIPGSPLYLIGADTSNHIACLASYDNGDTWHDFALSENPQPMYAPSGGSQLTADNAIVGIYTNIDVVESFRVDTPGPADLSRDGLLNFRDVAVLTAEWLDTGIWP